MVFGLKRINKKCWIQVGGKVGQSQIKKIPGEIIKSINKAVGFRLVTKFGQKGIINLGKVVPLIGGGIDAAGTKTMAFSAKKTFKENGNGKSSIIIDII